MYLYMYDNFTLIEQDKNAYFINYKERIIIDKDKSESFFISNLTCEKEYYFIISMATNYPEYYDSDNGQFVILDEKDDIKLSPLLSNSFSIHQREKIKKQFFIHIMKLNMLFFLLVII